MVLRKITHASVRVIIFDWDDTICPSSFVDKWRIEQFADMPSHFQKLFTEIAKCAEKCLNDASKYGQVFIITNSDDGWVKYSCERFLPRLLPVLDKYRIVSARTEYEKFYPGQPLCWKAAAFAHEVNEMYEVVGSEENEDLNTSFESCESLEATDVSSLDSSDSAKLKTETREIISFGDSMEERTAVRIVSEQLSSVPKSVMFVQSPSPLQLLGQLHMLTQHMRFICDHSTSLDLEISSEQANRCADSYMKRHAKIPGSDSNLTADLSKMMLRRTLSER